MSDKPAVLGGEPLSPEWVPMVRPSLPPYEELDRGLRSIINSGLLTKGPYLEEFESRVADHLGVKFTVGVSSCTLGLLLAYQAAGFSGGEILVPSFTFMATVHPLSHMRATPQFVDIDASTWCVDPRHIRSRLNDKTGGIVAVHNFGNPADIRELDEIARARGIPIVFDSAHGFGSLFEGHPLGRHGLAEVFSLSPTKLLIAGEGGIVATNDPSIADYVRLGREYGNAGDYNSEFPGLNARMSEFHALLGLKSLEAVESASIARNRIACSYTELLRPVPGLSFQSIRTEDRSSYKDFSVVVDAESFGLGRDALRWALQADNVDSRRYHFPPVHSHRSYAGFEDAHLPATARVGRSIVSLPIWSNMKQEVVERICEAIISCHHHAEAVAHAYAADSGRGSG